MMKKAHSFLEIKTHCYPHIHSYRKSFFSKLRKLCQREFDTSHFLFSFLSHFLMCSVMFSCQDLLFVWVHKVNDMLLNWKCGITSGFENWAKKKTRKMRTRKINHWKLSLTKRKIGHGSEYSEQMCCGLEMGKKVLGNWSCEKLKKWV